MPDCEKDEGCREQKSKHIAKGRECERHFFSSSPNRFSWLSWWWMMQAGSFATDLRVLLRFVWRLAKKLRGALSPPTECEVINWKY